MHGVLGQEGVSPAALVETGRREAAGYGVQFVDGVVSAAEDGADGLRVTLESGETHACRALVVATGITDELPDIPGLAQRWGTGVLHCPYCHGWEVADQRLGVLATSPASVHQVQMVRQWSDRVTVFAARLGEMEPRVETRLRARGIEIVNAEVVEVLGDGDRVTGVRTADGGVVAVDAIFTAGTPRPHDAFVAGLGLEQAELPFGAGSFLTVDPMGKTTHDRVWAAGNVVNPMANVPMSIGAGAMAGSAVNGALVEADFAAAEAAQALEVRA